MITDLDRRTALVIGGTSGYGLATAEQLADRGARVIIAGRSQERLQAALASNGAFSGAQADLTDSASVARLAESFGGVDFLVVSAAQVPSGRILESDLDALRPAVESRLFGAVRAIAAFAPLMPEDGAIVLFSGGAARKAFAGESMGSASCGAVESLVRTLAVELAPLRINAILPGSAMTPLFSDFFGERATEAAASIAASLPLNRLADPAEIADAVLWLLTNSYVTGSTLVVDGGQSIV